MKNMREESRERRREFRKIEKRLMKIFNDNNKKEQQAEEKMKKSSCKCCKQHLKMSNIAFYYLC